MSWSAGAKRCGSGWIALALILVCSTAALGESAGSAARSAQAGWIDAGGDHSCAISRGVASCWGLNTSGQAGVGGTISPSPVAAVRIPAGRRAVSIATGKSHSCAVLDDGTATCWGAGGGGQLGNDDFANAPTPVAVRLPSGRRAASIAAGDDHSCAVLDDGSAMCWGANGSGQLGDGSAPASSAVPVAVRLPAGRRATAIAAGMAHTCAILDDGMAVCWGSNSNGQLGDANLPKNAGTPVGVRLPTGRRVVAISAGGDTSCAVLDNAVASCWGGNYFGDLGNGNRPTNAGAPVAVNLPIGSRVTGIATGGGHSCAILENGSVACWGLGLFGEIGDGTQIIRSEPVAVLLPTGSHVIAVSAGAAHTCAALDDGSLDCWGSDFYKQRGDSFVGDRWDPSTSVRTLSLGSIPVRVANLSVQIDPVPPTLTPGQSTQVVVRVANTGPDPATGVSVMLSTTLLTVTAQVPSQGTVSGVNWQAQTIAPGAQAASVVTVSAAAAGSASLTAEVTAVNEPDPNSFPGNHVASEDDQRTVTLLIRADVPTGSVQVGPGPVVQPGPGPPAGRVRPVGLGLRVTRAGRRIAATGRLTLPAATPCTGTVVVEMTLGKRRTQVRVRVRGPASACRYSASLRAPGSGRLRVVARYGGSQVLLPLSSVRRTLLLK